MSQHRTLRHPHPHSRGTFLSTLCRGLPHMSNGSPNLTSKQFQPIRDFEEALTQELASLKPKGDETILCLDWLQKGLVLALEKHKEAVGLIPPFEFPLSECDEKWMSDYLDETTRILDVCNALSANISDIEQRHLLVRHAVHTLGCPGEGFNEEEMLRAQKSMCEWLETIQSRKEDFPGKLNTQNCSVLLQGMCDRLEVPKDKAVRKGNGFLFALFGANVTAIFVCSVLALALSREREMLSVKLRLADKFLWSTCILDLLQLAREEANRRISTGSTLCLDELHHLNTSVRDLLTLLNLLLGEKKFPLTKEQDHELTSAIQVLRRQLDALTEGLDAVGKNLNDFFHAVVASRSALLDNLGGFGNGDTA